MVYSFKMDLSVLPSEEDMPLPACEYRPRRPQDSDYYRCVDDYFETFVRVYDEHFSRQYGFWRPYVLQVIYRYLDCGDIHNGFARVKCKDCGHEYLLAFPCKCRCFQLAIFNAFLAPILRTCELIKKQLLISVKIPAQEPYLSLPPPYMRCRRSPSL